SMSERVALSPDGRWLGMVNHGIVVRDARTGHLVHALQIKEFLSSRPVFLLGTNLVAAAGENIVLFHDVTTGKEVRRVAIKCEYPSLIASGNGKVLAAFHTGNQAEGNGFYLIEAATGRLIAHTPPHYRNVLHGALSHDGQQLVSWGEWGPRD